MADERISLQLDLGQSTAAAKDFGQALATVSVVADQNTVPALHRVDTAAKQASSGHADFGRSVLQTSFIVQDFTSVLGTQGLAGALRSIQNNIPILVMAMGMGGGLAGALSIVSVGAGLLFDNWSKLTNLWGQGHTEAETKRIKELEKAAKDAAEATEKLFQRQPPFQQAPGQRFDKATGEFGGAAVLKQLVEDYKRAFGDFGADTEQLTKNLVGGVRGGDRQSINLFQQMLQGDDSDIGKRLRGEKTAKEDAETANRVKLREAEQRQKAQEADDKRVRDLMERITREDEDAAKRREFARGGQAMAAARDADRAVVQARRENAQNLNANGRQLAQDRRGIGDLQQQIGQVLEMEARGLASHEQAQMRIFELQAMISQLDQRVRQAEQRDRQLMQRQTILNRGR
jgi:hypothetical protein